MKEEVISLEQILTSSPNVSNTENISPNNVTETTSAPAVIEFKNDLTLDELTSLKNNLFDCPTIEEKIVDESLELEGNKLSLSKFFNFLVIYNFIY